MDIVKKLDLRKCDNHIQKESCKKDVPSNSNICLQKIKNDNPIPQGTYVPASRNENLIFTAGMTPRKNGVLIFSGKVKESEPLEIYKEAVIQAMDNALVAAENMLVNGEVICSINMLTVYINADPEFSLHSKLADYATIRLMDRFPEIELPARAAIGVASLPGNAPVEIQIICSVRRQDINTSEY